MFGLGSLTAEILFFMSYSKTGADRFPPERLPLFYLAFAHLSMALACVTIGVDPYGFLGFFVHPRALAVTHLITLGWITGSILGVM